MKHFDLPFTDDVIASLKAGEQITVSGVIYTARDAAHKRLIELLEADEAIPAVTDAPAPAAKGKTMQLSDIHTVYYAGPCPKPPGKPIGSAGPTTSSRMDKYSPALIAAGIKVMIGKGQRNRSVVEAIKEHKGLYLSAVGGAGAYYAQCVKSAKVIAFEDLGPEAIYKLNVKNMPLVAAIDSTGESIYDTKQI